MPVPARKTALSVQATIEGTPDTDAIEFFGQKFKLPEKIGLMPLLIFANAAKNGLSSDDMEGAAALYSMIHDCIAEPDWERFEALAIKNRADGDDLFGVVSNVMEIMSARPTASPSGSSRKAAPISRKSKVTSRSRVDTSGLTTVEALAR